MNSYILFHPVESQHPNFRICTSTGRPEKTGSYHSISQHFNLPFITVQAEGTQETRESTSPSPLYIHHPSIHFLRTQSYLGAHHHLNHPPHTHSHTQTRHSTSRQPASSIDSRRCDTDTWYYAIGCIYLREGEAWEEKGTSRGCVERQCCCRWRWCRCGNERGS